MKSNTTIHMAVRNIGDSSDVGEFFEGELKESILWLAAVLGSKVMQKRIVIGIGRDKLGATQGIELRRGGNNSIDQDELGSALDKLLAGDSPEEVIAGIAAPPTQSDLDTWKGTPA